MARDESDREDLIGEATAFHRRALLLIPVETVPSPIFAGLRASGGLAIYFDQDPVYQFDEHNRLRRAYVNGLLYRTQGDTLASLKRLRTSEHTSLQRSDLDPTQLKDFLDTMCQSIGSLFESLSSGQAEVVECVPPDDDLREELASRLRMITRAPSLAPVIPTRR